MEIAIFASLLVALAIVLMFWGLGRSIRLSEEIIEGRLGRYAASPQPVLAGEDAEVPEAGSQSARRRTEERSLVGAIARELARANLTITVSEFILLIVISTAMGLLVGMVLFRSVLGVIGAPVGFYLPRLYLTRRKGARLRAFDEQLADTLTMLAGSLRSGYSLVQAMDLVAHEGAPPTSEEFGRMVREVGLGLSMDDALKNLLRRVPSDDLDLVITVMGVQHEVGGNLAQILDTISYTIRERVRIKGEIKILTAYGRFSGYIIAGLPVVIALVLFIINRRYLEPLYSTTCGLAMLGTAAVSMTVGFLLIRRIIDIPV